MSKKVQVVGYLREDPDFSTDQKGNEVAVLSLISVEVIESAGWKLPLNLQTVKVSRESIITWLKQDIRKGDQLLIEGSLSYARGMLSTLKMKKTPYIVVNKRGGRIMRIIENKIPKSINTLNSCIKENTNENI